MGICNPKGIILVPEDHLKKTEKQLILVFGALQWLLVGAKIS